MSSVPRRLLEVSFHKAAQVYLHSLPLEHFMESTGQGTQRKITLESLDLVAAVLSQVHVYNELLVQWRVGRDKTIRQVVPDNMVVVHDGPIEAETSYDVPLQPAGPFWVFEYVSKRSERKDFEESFAKYEKELKVPYYLVFYPDNQELTLYHRGRTKYVSVKPNAAGRLAIPELEIEVGILDGWVRFWFRGRLLPLPGELQRELDETRRQLADALDELARVRAELERLRGSKP